MHHKGLNRLTRTIALVTISFSTVNTICRADGFRNPPPTATGIAKGNAHSVFVEDASATYYNPANLALLTTNNVQASAVFAYSELSWESAGIEADASWNCLPSVFSATPIGDSGLVFGLGITTPYGQGTEWDRTALAAAVPATALAIYEAQMKMITISPTLAMPVSEKLFLGAGVDIADSQLEMKMNLPSGITLLPFDMVGHTEMDGTGIGAHLGATFLLTESQRVALTYRSPMNIKYKGDFTIEEDSGLTGGALDGEMETKIKFPTTITAGYGIQITEALQLEAQIEWIEWSLYRQAHFKTTSLIGDQTLAQNWEDTWTIGVGGTYILSDIWTLNFGYAFLQSPIPDASYSPTFPDADRHVLSAGIGYRQNGHSLDVAYAYSIFKDRNIDSAENSDYVGAYEIDADLLGITYKYTF